MAPQADRKRGRRAARDSKRPGSRRPSSHKEKAAFTSNSPKTIPSESISGIDKMRGIAQGIWSPLTVQGRVNHELRERVQCLD
ncbi:MAG: hypothetical protein AB7O57_22860, partial [Hyphomicrobiaceae bacterium]